MSGRVITGKLTGTSKIISITSYCSYAWPVQSGPRWLLSCQFWSIPVNVYPEGDRTSKLRMIHPQISYDSIVLKKDTRVIKDLSIDGDQ